MRTFSVCYTQTLPFSDNRGDPAWVSFGISGLSGARGALEILRSL